MTNIVWHQPSITKADRQRLNQHKSGVLWFTGLPGSGKSTLANKVDERLHQSRMRSYVLDGDNIRHGLNKGLGFSKEDRAANLRRIGEVAKLFVDSGQIVLTAFVSPHRKDRDQIRTLFAEGEFIEIHVSCPLDICEKRDPKGLYQRAKKGEIQNFTGVDAPYEPPVSPELTIDTNRCTADEAADVIIGFLKEKEWI